MVATDEDPSLPDLLSRVEREVTGRLTALLAAEGCTVDEWRVLSLLARTGGRPMTGDRPGHAVAPSRRSPSGSTAWSPTAWCTAGSAWTTVDGCSCCWHPAAASPTTASLPWWPRRWPRIGAQAPGVDLGRLTGLLGDLLERPRPGARHREPRRLTPRRPVPCRVRPCRPEARPGAPEPRVWPGPRSRRTLRMERNCFVSSSVPAAPETGHHA